MDTNQYHALKNLIHNELGITKDDIKAWVMEAAKTVAREKARHIDIDEVVRASIDRRVSELVRSELKNWSSGVNQKMTNAIDRAITKAVSEELDVRIERKNK